jgi:glucose 1-dehydrogenase
MQRLKGQSALITGSSSGIGKAIALAMAREGANVVINFHSNESSAQQIVQEITSAGGNAIAVGANVSKEADVKRMFKEMFEAFGTIDILVNNAGMQKDAPFVEMTLEDWEKVIGVNLTGQFLSAREAAKEFIRRGINKEVSAAAGKIIFISSVHEVIPWAGHVNYAASKGGIMLLMKSIAQELAPYKIRVNSIAPGAIKTPINKSAWADSESEKKLLELIPYGRVGSPEDIAKAAVWLASEDADYVHGETLVIDGGMTLYPGFVDNG